LERMTLREAAARTSRSITTLRRYIRTGRLHAEKHYGRFGPEYFVSERDLADAGLDRELPAPALDLVGRPQHPAPLAHPAQPALPGPIYDPRWLREIVPLTLFQELQLKHEQLLVQYGMVRAAGLRSMELRSDLDASRQCAAEAEAAIERLGRDHSQRLAALGAQLRESQLELEGRRLEIEALRSKVRSLELLNRNVATTETIEQQVRRIHEHARRLSEPAPEAPAPARDDLGGEAGPIDH
jgi:hypothetical protein